MTLKAVVFDLDGVIPHTSIFWPGVQWRMKSASPSTKYLTNS